MRERFSVIYSRVVMFLRARATSLEAILARASRTFLITLAVLVCLSCVGYVLNSPPEAFPVRVVITIPEGATLSQTALILRDHAVIRSMNLFKAEALLLGAEESIKAGDYFFSERISSLEVASRLARGYFGLEPIRVLIPEGMTSYQIAERIASDVVSFDKETFKMLAREREGYLFPDTYYLLPNATVEQVLRAFEDNFYRRIEPLKPAIAAFGKPLDEVLTMASLLEKEANKKETRRKIAGILWHRLGIGMKLQVDAVFGYIKETKTFHPRFSDLEIDSPYNVYLYKGLPPGPIGNPGLSSIEAAVTPIKSDYLFYLTGKDGKMYYAKTFEEHLANKRKYLK